MDKCEVCDGILDERAIPDIRRDPSVLLHPECLEMVDWLDDQRYNIARYLGEDHFITQTLRERSLI
jgi:hypothetical protein